MKCQRSLIVAAVVNFAERRFRKFHPSKRHEVAKNSPEHKTISKESRMYATCPGFKLNISPGPVYSPQQQVGLTAMYLRTAVLHPRANIHTKLVAMQSTTEASMVEEQAVFLSECPWRAIFRCRTCSIITSRTVLTSLRWRSASSDNG